MRRHDSRYSATKRSLNARRQTRAPRDDVLSPTERRYIAVDEMKRRAAYRKRGTNGHYSGAAQSSYGTPPRLSCINDGRMFRPWRMSGKKISATLCVSKGDGRLVRPRKTDAAFRSFIMTQHESTIDPYTYRVLPYARRPKINVLKRHIFHTNPGSFGTHIKN